MNAYCEVLDRWGLSFVKTQIHVGFFDDILQAPQTFLDQICDFLGINRIEYTRTVRQNTRKTPELFPLTIKQEIVRLYQEDIHAAANRFGGHAVQWENKAVALLER